MTRKWSNSNSLIADRTVKHYTILTLEDNLPKELNTILPSDSATSSTNFLTDLKISPQK